MGTIGRMWEMLIVDTLYDEKQKREKTAHILYEFEKNNFGFIECRKACESTCVFFYEYGRRRVSQIFDLPGRHVIARSTAVDSYLLVKTRFSEFVDD